MSQPIICLFATIACTVGMCVQCAGQQALQRPNIVLIVADDQ